MSTTTTAPTTAAHNAKRLPRAGVAKRLVARIGEDPAVIGGIGHANFDLWAAGHRARNFYMLGSMGLAIPIGLGVALAQPRRKVFVLEGDGSLLMQMGCLSTVAAQVARERPQARATAIRSVPDASAGVGWLPVIW